MVESNENHIYFKQIDFKRYKKLIELKKTVAEDWIRQPNSVMVRPCISDSYSLRLNLSYLDIIFPAPTNGHYYKTQTDTILFRNSGKIEFSLDQKAEKRRIFSFSDGDAIEIAPPVVRKLIPEKEPLKIELIIQPRFNPEDEVHVYN